MKRLYLLSLILFLIPSVSFGQTVKGFVYDEATNESLPGVNVYYKDKSETIGVVTDVEGNYLLSVPEGGVTLIFSYLGYETQTFPLVMGRNQSRTINVPLKVQSQLMEEVVVSVGRYEQKLSDITVSMELLKASDIAKQSPTDLSAALKTIPGVDVNDKQPTIRSGSGWTYGVGSRCLILVDGQSALTPGSGEINWNIIPMENIEQVEVLKGASSVLYGSSALNGLINIRTKRPGLEPVTKVNLSLGIYGNPDNKENIWWSKDFWKDGKYPVEPLLRRNILSGIRNPIYNGLDFSHTRRIKHMDVSAGINYFSDEGYRSGAYTKRLRIGGNLTYHDPNVRGLNYGVNANFLSNDYASFFIWRSPEDVYEQSPLANMGRQSNTFYVDPFLNYTNEDKKTTHRLKGRIYRQNSQIVSQTTQKSVIDIVNNMGFDYNKIPEVVDLAQNWQTKLLPNFIPHLPAILQGDVTGVANEIIALGNKYFPTASTADYMDLASWVIGNTPLPKTAEEAIPWFINSLEPKEQEKPTLDYTTSYSLDYQFTKKLDYSQFTVGAMYEHVTADSKVTGNHKSDNAAVFLQYDHKFFDKLNVSVGGRLEYYRIDNNYREAETEIFGADIPVKPVFRGGLNYELAEYSFLRASFGQGYRYPSVTEKYVLKDIGGVGAFPNADLKAERGYNAELGIKQGYKFGNLKGYIDLAGFYTRYNDMIEFRIGLFDKKDFTYMTGLEDLIRIVSGGIENLGIGAQFYNSGRAEIYGIDVSTTGMYEFNPDTKLTYNVGYVYTNPIDLDADKRRKEEDANKDLLAMRAKSNDSKYLKYRQKHSVKGVFDMEWKRFSLGTNLSWKSKMLAVDYFFTDEREKPQFNSWDYIRSLLFGDLHGYWKDKNKSYFTMDLRMGIKLTEYLKFQAMINNVLNTEYSTRPMDVCAPRTFVMQLSANF